MRIEILCVDLIDKSIHYFRCDLSLNRINRVAVRILIFPYNSKKNLCKLELRKQWKVIGELFYYLNTCNLFSIIRKTKFYVK